MIPTFCFFIFVIITIDITCTTPVGYLYNASYVSNNINPVITYQNACSECICKAFFSNPIPAYVGLNCYKSNKTCTLIANYSTPSVVTANFDSTFIFIQQPPFPNTSASSYPLSGVTVGGYSNGTAATALDALSVPWGLGIDANNTLYISDGGNSRVIELQAGFLNGTIVAGGASGQANNALGNPAELKIDAHSNIYVDDNAHCRVMLWPKNASTGSMVVGTGSCNDTNNTIGVSVGLALDSQGNLYVSDLTYHRVMKWAKNATAGTLVAGMSGVGGSTNQLLNSPYGLHLDENNSYLYIADMANHRIQRYRLGTAANGTTVAGGNGQGSNSNQLNGPHGVYVSKNTGDIYIADTNNNRIQRWSPGAPSGVTIVGVTGVTSTDATMLNFPVGVIMDMNEIFLYVSDQRNNRVQRYPLT